MGCRSGPLTKGVPSVPGDTAVTGDSEKSRSRSSGDKPSLEHREETKKMSLVAAQVGPAIGFALQVLAQAK